jgi:hypothetical protein
VIHIRQIIVVAVSAGVIGAGGYQAKLIYERSAHIARLEHEVAQRGQQAARLRADVSRAEKEKELVVATESKIFATAVQLSPTGDPSFDEQIVSFSSRFNRLKARLAQDPRQQIPELRFLDDSAWFEILNRHSHLKPEIADRLMLSELRSLATAQFFSIFSSALRCYLKASHQQLPTELAQLEPYFVTPVDAALLDRYELRTTGSASEQPANIPVIGLKESSIVDDEIDFVAPVITITGAGLELESWTETVRSWTTQSARQNHALGKAVQAYRVAHRGEQPRDPRELLPFFTHPSQAEAFLKSQTDPSTQAPVAPSK